MAEKTERFRPASVKRLFTHHRESCENFAHGFLRFQIPLARGEETLENWHYVLKRSRKIFAHMGDLISAIHKRNEMRDRSLEAKGRSVLSVDWEVDWRMVTGLGSIGPMNTSLRLHHIYGFPMLDGSGFKGAVSNAYKRDQEQRLGIERWPALRIMQFKERIPRHSDRRTPWELWTDLLESATSNSETSKAEFDLLKKRARPSADDSSSRSASLDDMEFDQFFQESVEPYQRLFGAVNRKGTVDFFDVIPVELVGGSILELDVINPHHNSYYEELRLSRGRLDIESEEDPIETSEKNSEGAIESSNSDEGVCGRREPPADYDEPVPVFFLTLRQGTKLRFRAAARNTDDRNEIRDLLKSAATIYGLGGKVTDGYGELIERLGE